MTQSTDVVIAGSKPFLNTFFAPLSQRVGVRPRVAGDPAQTLALCRKSVRLLVFEYQGEQWLPLCRELNQAACGPLIIVAALPPEHAAAQQALTEAGVEQSSLWSGNPDHLLEAVEQALSAGTSEDIEDIDVSLNDVPIEDLGAASCHQQSAPASQVAPSISALTPTLPLAPAVSPPTPTTPPVTELLSTAPLVEVPTAAPQEFVPSEIWPGTVPPAEDAEYLLVTALSGTLPRASGLREVTQKITAALTPLEKAALQGAPVPVEGTTVRRASILRWQVSVALASLPAPGSQVDSGAIGALLAGMDAVLAEIAQLAEGSPPEVIDSLEQLRNALVKEAIDFTEAAHRITPHDTLPKAEVAHPTLAKVTKLLSIRNAVGVSEPVISAASRRWLAVFLFVAIGVGSYHGYRWLSRPVPKPIPTVDGAPVNSLVTPGQGRRLLIPEAGKTIAPEELERFRLQEAAKGNGIRPIRSGMYVIESKPVSPGAAGEGKP